MQAVEAFGTVLALVLRPKGAEFRHVDGLLLEQESYFPSDVKCNAIPPRGAHFASDVKRLAQPRGGGDVLTVLHIEQREPDTVLVSTAIIMEIPMVDRVEDEFYSTVRTGDQIEIDASEELAAITLTEHND